MKNVTFPRVLLAVGVVLLFAASGASRAASIQNSAGGSANGVALDPARATVSLNRLTGTVTSAFAEISPHQVLESSLGNAFVYSILPTIGPGDTGVAQITIDAPPGYSNLAVSSLEAGGTSYGSACPVPGPGQYCATVSGTNVTIALGTKVTTTLAVIRIGLTVDAPPTPGSADFVSAVADGGTPVGTLPGDADGNPANANGITVEVQHTQGLVLRLEKLAATHSAVVGDVILYSVAIRNPSSQDVVQVRVEDKIPPNFKYVKGSARLDGAAMSEPTGNRPLVFDVGLVPAFADVNANGAVDPGEPGYRILTYQLVVGSGATPGSYVNAAVAKDFCDACLVSNDTGDTVEVRLDPLFDLATIVGKVFEDRNRNDRQDPDEQGVGGAMVALDDGTYALTDEFGRYHVPAVRPGYRMLKLNLQSLPAGTEAATEESRVVQVTPGLLVRANFGVILRTETAALGRPDTPGIAISSETAIQPVEVLGNAESLALLIDDMQVPLPSADVALGVAAVDDVVNLAGGVLKQPVRFTPKVHPAEGIATWRVTVRDSAETAIRAIEGAGRPPDAIVWDGRSESGQLVEFGSLYQYQLEIVYGDGSRAASPRRLLGVNRQTVVSLRLSGDAFETGKDVLSARARKTLDDAAVKIRNAPDQKIVIEGHTDDVGDSAANLELSRRRAQSALDYLTRERGLPTSRFTIMAYGEDRPIASNATPEGRELNRRVNLQGDLTHTAKAEILESYRTEPHAAVDGAPVAVGEQGRFRAAVSDVPGGQLTVEASDSEGRSAKTTVSVPELQVLEPRGNLLLVAGKTEGGCTVTDEPGRAGAVTCRIAGRTQPGNVVEIDGHPVPTEPDGSFAQTAGISGGDHIFGIIARNPAGFVRAANLELRVTERDAEGRVLLAVRGTPSLAVQLPPAGLRLPSQQLTVWGVTAPGNRVRVNGREADVRDDGRFSVAVELPLGASVLTVEAEDPEGRKGTLTREVEVARHQLFLLAFADGKIGQLKANGYVDGAGANSKDDLYTDGRVAFYLKGLVAGKWLITSALDTKKSESDSMFRNLDPAAANQLLTNLDPDKLYPVYGDGSTLVYDAQSRGKFYLAVDSDEIHVLAGNYPLSLNDTELAAYQRTLYGGRFVYQSASRTRYGAPDTSVVVFGADVSQAHVRDELRATGGSVYYLSRKDVIQGSEEVTLVVRDKNTNLVLSRLRQAQNVDYVIKYEEGRLLFQRPVASVQEGGSLFDPSVLSGNPVYIQVDYETTLAAFDKIATGGRVRQQIGDHVALGGTYVKDESPSGPYTLKAADAELRIGSGSRLTAEFAESEGSDGGTQVSYDGGLTYGPAPSSAPAGLSQSGSAKKFAADLDVGAWFGTPDRYRVGVYFKDLDPGFISAGTAREQGQRKTGVQATLKPSAWDTIVLRVDRDQLSGGAGPAGAADRTLTSARWDRTKERWGVNAEYFLSDAKGAAATAQRRMAFATARFWAKLTKKITARIERQQTLTGDAPDRNDQTSLGLDVQVLPRLALELMGTHGTRGTSGQVGAIFKDGEKTVYVTERESRDGVGRKSTTVLGARSPIGASSKVYSEYQWDDSRAGRGTTSLLGVQREWNVFPGFKLVLAGETADIHAPSADGKRLAVSLGATYADGDRFTLQSRNEVRRDAAATTRVQALTFTQFEMRLNQDFRLLARWRWSRTHDEDRGRDEAAFEERSLGFAYRPVRNDAFNALARYTRLYDMRPVAAGSPAAPARTADVVSFDGIWEISTRFEWVTKLAAKRQVERAPSLPDVTSDTYLGIQRFNYNFWRPLDLGVEYRMLRSQAAEDRRRGWLAELMWKVQKHFRVGVGYNFTDFSDDEYAQNDYSVQGWFVRVQGRY